MNWKTFFAFLLPKPDMRPICHKAVTNWRTGETYVVRWRLGDEIAAAYQLTRWAIHGYVCDAQAREAQDEILCGEFEYDS